MENGTLLYTQLAAENNTDAIGQVRHVTDVKNSSSVC